MVRLAGCRRRWFVDGPDGERLGNQAGGAPLSRWRPVPSRSYDQPPGARPGRARGRQLRAPHGRGGARGERRVRRFLPESWMRSRRRAPLRRAGRRSRRGRSGDAWRGDIGRRLAGARPGGISARTRRADAEPRRDVTVRPRLPGGPFLTLGRRRIFLPLTLFGERTP